LLNLSKLPPTANYYVLDLEFTHSSSQLIEIGVVSIQTSIEPFFHTLVNPDTHVDAHVTLLTGITQDMLKDAPSEQEAIAHLIASFQDVQQPHILVWGSDEKILKKAAKRSGLEACFSNYLFYDMRNFLEGLRFFFPDLLTTPRSSLHEVAKNLGCANDQSQTHRALDDAFETAQVIQILMEGLRTKICFQ